MIKRVHQSLKYFLYYLLLSLGVSFMWSCGNVKQLQYMQGSFDTALLSQVQYPEPLIQKNELISITVYSADPRASAYYNLPQLSNTDNTIGGSGISKAGVAGSSYLVDETGNIHFPGIGTIKVAGLTKKELYKLLEARLQDKLVEPYFIIRLSSYKITLLGEVGSPGQYTIPNERVSLLEAIALAGDLTVYGKRDNVLIIREINGQRTWGRVDLRAPEILNSPYFFLQPNDVVYVDPNRSKAAVNDQILIRNITVATGVISVLAVVIGILR